MIQNLKNKIEKIQDSTDTSNQTLEEIKINK